MNEGLRWGLLGPLVVRIDDRLVPVGSPRCRTLLAALLLAPGELLSTTQLASVIWGEAQPDNPRRALQVYVARLRALLEDAGAPSLIQTGNDGYRIDTAPRSVDVSLFRLLVHEAELAAQRSDAQRHSAALHEALALWRGEPLADVPSELLHRDWVSRLREQRLSAVEQRIEADLRLGPGHDLVDELRELTIQNPLRERLWLHLVTVLHRGGRRVEALKAYHEGRRRLADELGVDPSEDLQRLYARVLANTSATGAAALPFIPRQLPPGLSSLVGRTAELSELDLLLQAHDAGEGAAPPTIVVVTGTAGVGKTALALHWSRRVAERFPDGQIWIDLRGYARRGVVTPERAMSLVLGALGVRGGDVPSDLDGQTGLYRSLMDGRRMLIVLDNAADADQVRPLLPGTGSLVLITSRHELTALVAVEGARPVRLHPFTVLEARQLLESRLGRRRTDAEPAAADRIGDRCGRLPLALAIVSARAAADPAIPLVALDQRLATAGRLDALSSPDATIDVRTAFSWSYRALSPPAARLFRLLGMHPTPEFSAQAAASLTGLAETKVRPLLDEAAGAHLVDRRGLGRFAVHELLHAYAAELVEHHESPAARLASRRRLLQWLTHAALSARPLLQPSESSVAPPAAAEGIPPVSFGGERHARQWYEAERHNLIAAVHVAHAEGLDDLCWRLAYAIWIHLQLANAWDDMFETHRVGLRAAEREADRIGQAHMLGGIGVAFRSTRQPELAIEAQRQALALFHEAHETVGESTALSNLGAAYRDHGDLDAALDCCQRAYAAERDRGDVGNMAISLYQIALTQTAAGRPAAAVTAIDEALGLLRKVGHRRGEARALQVAATAQLDLGQHEAAIGALREAVRLYRDLGDRRYEAAAAVRLGDAFHRAGRFREGRRTWAAALAIYTELRAPEAANLRTRLHYRD